MSKNISKRSNILTDVSELPEKYKVYMPFYEVKLGSPVFIEKSMYENMFAVVSSGVDKGKSTQKLYLFIYSKGTQEKEEVNSRVRKIIYAYKDMPAAPYDLEIVFLGNETVRDVISNEYKKQTTQHSKIEKAKKDGPNKKEMSEAADAIKKAEDLLFTAMKLKASDLHIESDGKVAVVRLRIHKELSDHTAMSHDKAVEMCELFYGQFVRGTEADQEKGSGKGIYVSGNILDGEFSRAIEDVSMKARMVNIGANYQDRYTMVLRLIDRNKAAKPISYAELGFSKESCTMLKVLQRASRGMILICGVTGSGKSTSIQNMMMHERDRCGNTRKMYSIEQPIEQQIPRITQINASNSHENEEAKTAEQDFSFDNLNRALMRGDPDSITYGEIRDKNTAYASVKGVESGHLVYGTMHVSDAMGAFSRFETFGVGLDKLCRKSFIQMIMYQHLIPKLCPLCSIEYKRGEKIPLEFGEWYAIKTFKYPDGRGINMSDVFSLMEKMEPGGSLLRAIQRERLISAYDVSSMIQKINSMNSDNNNGEFQVRLDNLISSSSMAEKDTKIRFRGDGCKNCHQGTIGVIPATEILIPDETFLDLIANRKTNQAEAYWKSKLGGRSATRDMYSKILTGVVDPRMVETELSDLGT